MMLKKILAVFLSLVCAGFCLPAGAESSRTLTLRAYRNAVKAAWLGKMVGVSAGRTNEFYFKGQIAPSVTEWNENLLDIAYIEDDLYIPFAMLKAIDEKGIDISGREMAISMYPYSFEFWSNHLYAFEMGYAPPYAGHPDIAAYPDALSYSFGADFSGLVSPGDRSIPMDFADRFGSMLVYGDGIYGGAFIGTMYSEAFFSRDMLNIILQGLKAIPGDSWLAMAIEDVIDSYQQGFVWEETWRRITEKYYFDPEYNWIEWPYGGRLDGIDLDVKLNCAYIAIALLYGGGDIDETLRIALSCGEDTDSNAGNALGILFTTIGFDQLTPKYTARLNEDLPFAYVQQSFAELVDLTERVALMGCETAEEQGETVFLIPEESLQSVPGEAVNSKYPADMEPAYFTREELARMVKPALQDGGFEDDWHPEIDPPWQVIGCGNGVSGIDLRAGKASEGKNNAYLCPGNGKTMGIAQNRIAIIPDVEHTLSCDVRTSGDDVSLALRVINAMTGSTIAQLQTAGGQRYATLSLTFTTAAEQISIQLLVRASASGAWVQADHFVLDSI